MKKTKSKVGGRANCSAVVIYVFISISNSNLKWPEEYRRKGVVKRMDSFMDITSLHLFSKRVRSAMKGLVSPRP